MKKTRKYLASFFKKWIFPSFGKDLPSTPPPPFRFYTLAKISLTTWIMRLPLGRHRIYSWSWQQYTIGGDTVGDVSSSNFDIYQLINWKIDFNNPATENPQNFLFIQPCFSFSTWALTWIRAASSSSRYEIEFSMVQIIHWTSFNTLSPKTSFSVSFFKKSQKHVEC